VAGAIEERARAAWKLLEVDFPGDTSTGELTGSEEWREWFFTRHAGLTCPVLDEGSGTCLLYEYRPICCRLYGPLIEIGGQTSEPCQLCFAGASPEEVKESKVTVTLPESAPVQSETVIAYALSCGATPSQ
jgi:Fe-S-cluster containining protein